MRGKTYIRFFKCNILSFLIKFNYKILEKDFCVYVFVCVLLINTIMHVFEFN